METIPLRHEVYRFSYSDAEIREIFANLGDPGIAEEAEQSPQKDQVLLLLGSSSQSCLHSAFQSQFDADKDITITKGVVKASKKMLKQIRHRYSDGESVTDMIFEITPKFEILKLEEILVHIAKSEKKLLRHTKFKQNRGFERSRNPAFYQFVGVLIELWCWWKREEPGGSKSGGPAARFVMSAANPVIAFAKNRMNVDLQSRRKGPLDECAAGELIAHIKALRITDEESFISARNWYGG